MEGPWQLVGKRVKRVLLPSVGPYTTIGPGDGEQIKDAPLGSSRQKCEETFLRGPDSSLARDLRRSVCPVWLALIMTSNNQGASVCKARTCNVKTMLGALYRAG